MTSITNEETKKFNASVIEKFRANEGKVGGAFENASLLLLNTTGAKSGKMRTNPLVYLEDGDALIVSASYAGADVNPPWFHNLVANPEVTVEVGNQVYSAIAKIVSEPRRSQFYAEMVNRNSVFADYQESTDRIIPMVELTHA